MTLPGKSFLVYFRSQQMQLNSGISILKKVHVKQQDFSSFEHKELGNSKNIHFKSTKVKTWEN